jgi:hypothetical protein
MMFASPYMSDWKFDLSPHEMPIRSGSCARTHVDSWSRSLASGAKAPFLRRLTAGLKPRPSVTQRRMISQTDQCAIIPRANSGRGDCIFARDLTADGWRTEVRRYEGKVKGAHLEVAATNAKATSTTARFDKTEPAATRVLTARPAKLFRKPFNLTEVKNETLQH